MFENDYKNEIEKIKPDGFIKYKIRQTLEAKDKKPKTKYQKIYFGRAVAALLCVAIVFTAGAVFGRQTVPLTTVQNIKLMKTANDYDKIYSNLAVFKESFFEKFSSPCRRKEKRKPETSDFPGNDQKSLPSSRPG